MPTLSIVIPVYNVEKYLERCIRSVAEQDLSADDYEILVINDGSPDGSLEIAQKVALDYKNISIFSQENTGLGGARNLGITMAKGEYIWFIDSDDFIAENCLKQLVHGLKDKNLDVLAFDFKCANETGDVINWIDFKLNFNNSEILSGPEFYALNYKDSYIWLYIFRKSCFTHNDITFKKRINMQDSELLPRLLHHVQRIAFLDRAIYYYVNREDSFINSSKITTRVKYYKSIIKVYNYLFEFRESLNQNSLIKSALTKKLQEIHRMLFLQYLYTDFDIHHLKELLEELKAYRLFPFKGFKERSLKKNVLYTILRTLMNINPIKIRKAYLALRGKY